MNIKSFNIFFQNIRNRRYDNQAQQFRHYFYDTGEWLRRGERCFDHLSSIIPPYINAILDIGCANGRNFQHFSSRYKCYGIDIAPVDWVRAVGGGGYIIGLLRLRTLLKN